MLAFSSEQTCTCFRKQPPSTERSPDSQFVGAVTGSAVYTPERGRIHTLIVTEGRGTFGGQPFEAGQVWLVPASAEPFPISVEAPVKMLDTWVPPRG
ncbi:MAG TPA: hypothetical protein VHA11_07755 [Bryobacteraceae bacterium]|nr:hypothetical protein [Bryobacteraceae bacterium]